MIQPLGIERHAHAVMPQHLDQIAAPPAEDVQIASVRIALQAVDGARRRLGLRYWSLSKHAKVKVKNAVAFISHFEEVVARAAGSRGVDGVVCGHIHTAEMREIAGLAYYNDGDWVESCTALVEHRDGRMELLHWADEIARRGRPPAALTSVSRQ